MVSPRVERRKADSLRSLIGRACEPVEPPASGSRHERPSMPRADSTCWVSPPGGSTGTPRLFGISHERLLTNSVLNAYYPKLENKYLVESEKEYPISVNGKLRTTMVISLEATQPEVENMVLNNEIVQKWTNGKSPKKIIFVKNKMVNVVI